MKGHEKRRFGRYPCRLRVQFSSPRHLKEHFITNIGDGGVFVETFYPLEIGTPVDLEILISEHADPLRILGEVVWAKGPSDEGTTGMGIRFQKMSAEVRQNLSDILENETLEPMR